MSVYDKTVWWASGEGTDDITHVRYGAEYTSVETSSNQEVASQLATDNEQLRLWYLTGR